MFKSALVIDSRKDVRTAVRASLKELGVSDAKSADNVTEALQVLKSIEQVPDWLIVRMEFEIDSGYTSYDLMRLLLRDKKFAKTAVSLLFEDEQGSHLPPLFEMGALSAHKGPFTQQSLTSEIKELFQEIETHGANKALVAARYLRNYLSEVESFDELVLLEKALFASFPKNQQLLLHLIEAKYLNNDIDDAKKLLRQAKYLGKNIQTGVKQLADMLNIPELNEVTDASFGPEFGMSHVLVVDSDTISSSQIEKTLKSLGIAKVQVFSDGNAALEYVSSHPDIDLVVQEWRFSGMSGASFLQRLRRDCGFMNLVFVTSSLLKKEDFMLLTEMGADCVIEKPINSDDFTKNLISHATRSKFPVEAKTVARQIRVAIEANKYDEAKALYKIFLGFTQVPEGVRLQDGAAELLNIIFGFGKRKLNAEGHEIKKAIPSVVRGKDIKVKVQAGIPSFVVPMTSPAGSFFFQVSLE